MPAQVWQIITAIIWPGVIVALGIWYKERIAAAAREGAREATEKELADYRQEHARELSLLSATLNAMNQRRFHEFGLLTGKRYEVYPRLYGRYKLAADYYSTYVGLMLVPAFDDWDKEQAAGFLNGHKASARLRNEVLAAYDAGRTDQAERMLSDFYFDLRRMDAERAFERAKSTEALNELYFSDAVRAKVTPVRQEMASLSAKLRFPDPHAPREDKAYPASLRVQAAVHELFATIRAELQRGDVPPELEMKDGGSQ
jgi:hypothetical protein